MTARKSPKKKSVFKKTTARKTDRKNATGKKAGKKNSTPPKKSKKKRTGYNSKYVVITDLPDCYNRTYLRALPKDPEWLFAYWEISKELIDTLRNKMGDEQFEAAKPILRLLDITDIDYNGTNAWKCFDIHVHYYANNWYVKVPEPGRVYIIEYGTITPEGVFFSIMQSNVVKTPRDNYSEIIDEEWSTASSSELTRFTINYPEESFGGASDSIMQTAPFAGSSENIPPESKRK